MGTLIHKCCVCGTITSIEKRNDVNGERISHNYCSKDCTTPEEYQVLAWSDKYNMYVGERAFHVRGKYYFNQAPLLDYLFISGKDVYGANVTPDGKQYAEDILSICSSRKEALDTAKDLGRKHKITIIL
jgi:hypothetical protein